MNNNQNFRRNCCCRTCLAARSSRNAFGGMNLHNVQYQYTEPYDPFVVPFDNPQPLSNMDFITPNLIIMEDGLYQVTFNVDFSTSFNSYVRVQATSGDGVLPALSTSVNTQGRNITNVSQSALVCLKAGQHLGATITLTEYSQIIYLPANGAGMTAVRIGNCGTPF